ncbi:MAG TPA: hypothetical protein VMH02_03510 [Verrucomicrobiae bacterium]|nr:hypothetical protein [Verrucomicrobiae bacterium]
MTTLSRCVSLAVAAAAIAFPSAASVAAASPQQATVQSLVGNWSCVTHTSDNKTYHETDVNSTFGPWLKISAAYPAQEGQPAASGLSFFGYDSKHARWYITSVDTMGGYGSSYSNSKSFGGSQWHDGYPDNNGSAAITASKNQFVVDGKGPNAQGKTVTSHEICTRA